MVLSATQTYGNTHTHNTHNSTPRIHAKTGDFGVGRSGGGGRGSSCGVIWGVSRGGISGGGIPCGREYVGIEVWCWWCISWSEKYFVPGVGGCRPWGSSGRPPNPLAKDWGREWGGRF